MLTMKKIALAHTEGWGYELERYDQGIEIVQFNEHGDILSDIFICHEAAEMVLNAAYDLIDQEQPDEKCSDSL